MSCLVRVLGKDIELLWTSCSHYLATLRRTFDWGLRDMVSGRTEFEQVITRLQILLNDVWDQRPAGATMSATAPLVSLGVDSLTLALLLEKVGKEFHIDWTGDTHPGGAISLRSIADLVLRRDGGGATGAEV
jgi:clorobiocin biosynthesis protein CloN1